MDNDVTKRPDFIAADDFKADSPLQTPSVSDIDPESAAATQGWNKLGSALSNSLQEQYQKGGEQIHQALQGDPASNPQAREALENLGSQAAMSTVGKSESGLPMDSESISKRAFQQGALPELPLLANQHSPENLDVLRKEAIANGDRPQIFYHGSPNSPFDEFKQSYQGSTTGEPDADKAIFFTAGRANAEGFRNITPETIKKYGSSGQAYMQAEPAPEGQGHILEAHLKVKNPAIFGDWDEYGDAKNEDIANAIEQAKDEGHDALIIKGHIGGHDTVAVFKPNQIRKTTAAFDPKKAKSANLSYAQGGNVNSPQSLNAMQYYAEGDVVQNVPRGTLSPIPDPTQAPGFIPASQFTPDAQTAMPQDQSDIPVEKQPGFIPASQFQSDEDKYTTYGQQAIAAGEAVGQGLLGPLAPAAELATGLTTPEAIRARQQYNPELEAVLKPTAFITGALSGTGEAALLGRAGEAAASAAGLTSAASLSAKIGSGALRGATELGLLSAGDEATRAIIQDPTTSVPTALTDIGLSALLGIAGGGILSGGGALLTEGLPKLAQELENFKGQLNYRANVPEPVTAMHEELAARYNELKDIYDETYGASGLKAKAIAQAVPPTLSDAILGQANDISESMSDAIKRMRAKPYSYPERLVNKLESDANEYRNKIFPTDGSSPHSTQDIFNATQDLKQMTQSYAQYQKFIKPVDEAYDFSKAMKPIASNLKDALEDTDVWGNAAKLQQDINSNFVKFKPFIEGFEKTFTDKVPDIATGEINNQVSLGKLQTYLNQAGGFRDAAKKNIMKGFLDNGEKFAAALDDAYKAVGTESPFTRSPMVLARRSLDETTPGMKIANALVDKGLGQATARSLGAGIGGIGGHTIAGPYGAGIGALLGEKALGPMFEKVLPNIAKPLLESVSDARGFRVAGRFIESAVRGQKIMSDGAKNVFKAGAEVLPATLVPSITKLSKLNQQLVAAQNHPDQFAQNVSQNPLGTYMPTHAQALGQTLGNVTNYVNAQRPNTAKKAPLDSERAPSGVAQGAFNNLLRIAQQPMTLMQKVKEGTLTSDDIKHINAMYPAAWQQMQKELSNAMATHLSQGKVVPYKTRLGLSIMMGQPMDSTMTPQAIQSAQPQAGQPNAPQAQAPKQGSKSSTKNLHKVSDQALTPDQARTQRVQRNEK